MKSGPYLVRIGHHDEEGKKIDWISEFSRVTNPKHYYERCSFYVPLLTRIVLALKQDPVDTSKNPTVSRRPFRVSIDTGKIQFSDHISADDDSVHLYGANISKTPFQGRDVDIAASEETIEVIVTDVEGIREFATFEYTHLEWEKVPDHIDLDRIYYEAGSAPLEYSTALYTNRSTTVRHPRLQEIDEEGIEELDEPMTSDDEATNITEVGATKSLSQVQAKQPTTPTSKRVAPETSLTPQFKILGSKSTPKVKVKPEMLQLQVSPNMPKSPAYLIRKETERKVTALDRQLQAAKSETKTLEVVLDKKKAKAKTTFDRADRRAQEEYDAALHRNREMKEELEGQLKEQKTLLKWVQDSIMANADVIVLSDDSDSEAMTHLDKSDSEEDDSNTPTPSPQSSLPSSSNPFL